MRLGSAIPRSTTAGTGVVISVLLFRYYIGTVCAHVKQAPEGLRIAERAAKYTSTLETGLCISKDAWIW